MKHGWIQFLTENDDKNSLENLFFYVEYKSLVIWKFLQMKLERFFGKGRRSENIVLHRKNIMAVNKKCSWIFLC